MPLIVPQSLPATVREELAAVPKSTTNVDRAKEAIDTLTDTEMAAVIDYTVALRQLRRVGGEVDRESAKRGGDARGVGA